MVLIICNPATVEQINQMAEAYFGLRIKLAVDVAREILAGGGELHADCEEVLLEDGSQQENIWGADWYPETKEVGFESLINIRPRQQKSVDGNSKSSIARKNRNNCTSFIGG